MESIEMGGQRSLAWLRPGRFALCLMLAGALASAQQPGPDLVAFKAGAAARARLADATGVYNDLVAAQVASNGRFNFGAFPAGGSNRSGSQSFNLSFAWPSGPGTSYTTVRVDGQDLVFGQSELPLSGAPVNNQDTSTAIAANSQIRVTQTLSLVLGPNSGRADTVRIAYQLTNLTAAAQQAGLRIMVDTMLAGNDAAPFRIPGLGAITTERLFEGPQVPTFWQAFQSLEKPGIASQGTLIGSGAVTPTRFALANWGHLQGSLYDFVPNTTQSNGDSGIGIWWDNLVLGPSQSVEVVTFYGLGDQSVAQGSVRLGVAAPAEVSPAQPRFQVAATVENPSSELRADVIVELVLPPGLVETAARGRSVASLGDLGPGQSGAAVFEVDASGVAPGTYAFTVKAGPRADPNPVQVTRQVRVLGDGTGPEPPGPVAPASSFLILAPNSPVDPATGQAPLGASLDLRAQLNDANGQPVPGIAPSRVTYTVTPAAGATVTPGTAASDAGGVLTAVLVGLERGEVTVTAAFDGTPFGAPVVLRFDDVLAAQAVYELAAGLHLLAQPVIVRGEAVTGRGRGLLTSVFYDALERRYFAGDGLPSGAVGRGFFIRNTASLNLAADGFLPFTMAPGAVVGELLHLHTYGADEPAGAGSARQVLVGELGLTAFPLQGEWNLLGNPYGFPLTWHLERLEVWVNAARLGTLADPVTWAYVDPYAFVYERGGYRLIFDPALAGFEQVANQIGMLRGFWVRRTPSADNVELRYRPTAASTAVPARAATGQGWTLGLTASSGSGQAHVTIGADASLSRSLAIGLPPAAGEPEVELALLSGADRLAGQVLNRAAGEYGFTAEVTGRAGREVTLTWSGLGRQLPAGYQAVLTDLQSGQRLSMRTRSLYVYQSQGETRRFSVQLSRGSAGALAVQVQAAPTRSRGASLTLVLTQPAQVHLRITSLSGRLVREVASQAAAAGAATVTWDGLDQSGRRVPAGLYQVLAVAESDTGELARAMATVRVP